MTNDDKPSDAEIHELTRILFTTGMTAQIAAMHALTEVVEQQVGNNPDNNARTAGLAGAIAFTQWKLDAALKAITKAYPQYAELINGAREAAAETFGDSYEEGIRDVARKFNVPYPPSPEETVQ